jgi:hypothetical protein
MDLYYVCGKVSIQLPPPPQSGRSEDEFFRGVFGLLFALGGLYWLMRGMMRAVRAEGGAAGFLVGSGFLMVLGIPLLASILRGRFGRTCIGLPQSSI